MMLCLLHVMPRCEALRDAVEMLVTEHIPLSERMADESVWWVVGAEHA